MNYSNGRNRLACEPPAAESSLPILPALAVALVFLAPTAVAVGSYLQDQDPETTTQSNALVSAAEIPFAASDNFPGITSLQDQQFQAGSTGGAILYLSFNPVIVWRITNPLSFEVCPSSACTQAVFEQGFGAFNPTNELKLDGDAVDVNSYAGLLWQPMPDQVGGVNYQSATTTDSHDKPESSSTRPFPQYAPPPTHKLVRIPQLVAGGIAYHPTPNWNLELGLDWTDWDNVNEIVFQGTPLGNIPFVLNYQSSFMYQVGVTRQLAKGYFVSTGYIYSENSSPDRNYSPTTPESNLHLGSVGFGHHGERWDWAVGYHFAFNQGRTVQDDVNPIADGTYRTLNNTVNVSATFRF